MDKKVLLRLFPPSEDVIVIDIVLAFTAMEGQIQVGHVTVNPGQTEATVSVKVPTQINGIVLGSKVRSALRLQAKAYAWDSVGSCSRRFVGQCSSGDFWVYAKTPEEELARRRLLNGTRVRKCQ